MFGIQPATDRGISQSFGLSYTLYVLSFYTELYFIKKIRQLGYYPIHLLNVI